MHIHTTERSEALSEIAEKYTVSEEFIRRINSLNNEDPTEGEELLILQPTRSYKVHHGDTPERIALRFGIRVADIRAQNPWIINRDLKEGEEIALKYSDRSYGTAVANGYLYKGCSLNDVDRAIPYLTYLTVACATAERDKIKKTFDDTNYVRTANEKNKIPLIRVHDKYTSRYVLKDGLESYAKQLIDIAKSGKYKGIVIDTCGLGIYKEIFSDFLVKLRKMMLGCDLILITEINEKSPIEFSEYADASVFYYPKYAMKGPATFDEGERQVLNTFACQGESARTFVDLPSLIKAGNGFIGIDDGLRTARKNRFKINKNKDTLLSSYYDKLQGECSYISLEGIMEIFKLIRDYDYMGICFDIMRSPMSHLMMYNSLFKTSYYANVRSTEGCSRGGED